jgi:hypothetical protein
MIKLIRGPATARRAHEVNRGVHLGDSYTDRVALGIQGRSMCRRHLNVIGNARVVPLIRVVRGALRGGSRGFVGFTLVRKMMQAGKAVFNFLVGLLR